MHIIKGYLLFLVTLKHLQSHKKQFNVYLKIGPTLIKNKIKSKKIQCFMSSKFNFRNPVFFSNSAII